jgi:hypothetical protein
LGFVTSFKVVLHQRQAAEAEHARLGSRICDVCPNDLGTIAHSANAKKRKRSIVHEVVEGCRRQMRRFR